MRTTNQTLKPIIERLNLRNRRATLKENLSAEQLIMEIQQGGRDGR